MDATRQATPTGGPAPQTGGGAGTLAGDAGSRPGRVGPAPAPPPERLDTMAVLDLLATARRWRVHEPFVAGQADGLSRALIACLNARRPVPRWLRRALLAYLLEALWEQPPPAGSGTGEWDQEVEGLLARWREPAQGQGPLG